MVVTLEFWLNPDSAGHDTSDALSEGKDFKIMDGFVEGVDFLGVKFVEFMSEFFVNVVFENVVFEFGRDGDFVFHVFQEL